jgi:hypothetical protein
MGADAGAAAGSEGNGDPLVAAAAGIGRARVACTAAGDAAAGTVGAASHFPVSSPRWTERDCCGSRTGRGACARDVRPAHLYARQS